MSATHEITVLASDGASLELRLAIVHPQESALPLSRAAWVSMLSANPKLPPEIARLIPDEPTRKEAEALLGAVELLSVQGGVLEEQDDELAFVRRESKRTAPSAIFRLRLLDPEIARHFGRKQKWRTAPLSWDDD